MQPRVLAVAGVLLVFLAVGLASVMEGGFDTTRKLIAFAGIALLTISAILAFGSIVSSLRSRQGRFGMNVITGTVLFLGILVLVNFLGNRYKVRRDFTANRQFSLAGQSQRVLDRLEDEVVIYSFVPRELPIDFRRVQDLARSYADASDKVRVEYVDARNEPATLERLKIDNANIWIAIESGEHVERLSRVDVMEEGLTNALLRIASPERKKIYFLAGHGERAAFGVDSDGYGELSRYLETENFDVDVWSFVDEDTIPSDGSLLIVAGPTAPIVPEEMAALAAWLDQGNSALFLIGPVYEDGRPLALGVEELFDDFGVTLGPGRVFDASKSSELLRLGKYSPLGTLPRPHAITRGVEARSFVVFRNVRGVSLAQRGRGTGNEFMSTGPRTWEEMDPLGSEDLPTFDKDRDRAGPIPVAVAVSEPVANWRPDVTDLADPDRKVSRPETRIVIFGDGSFAANTDFRAFRTNRDLTMNAIRWLVQDDDLIAVRPRDRADRQLLVRATERNVIRSTSLVFYPVLVLGVGVLVWFRRRRKDV